MTTPPPECPAHGLGPGGLRRLYGPEAAADPMALYEKLRAEHGTVAPVLVHGDLNAWIVLGHHENLEAMRNPSRFSRDSRIWRHFREGNVAMDSPLLPMVAWQPLCVFADGAEHERLRGAVTTSMGRLNRRGIRQHIIRFSNQLVDEFCQSGEVELVTQFAEQLPVLVMTQLLGMPEEYGPKLVEAGRDLMRGTETAVASNEYVLSACKQLVQRKRADPGGDLTSWLLRHEANLTDDEVAEHLRLILIAANEPTVNFIVGALKMVLTDPRFRAHLSGGHMTLPDALEQVLWDEPSIAVVPGRWATGATELGGQQIEEGDMVMFGIAAGNVDPRVRPDLSTPVHGNRSHLAFSSGPHECPGKDIARAIVDTAIDTLLMRLPDLRVAVPEEELTSQAAWISRHLVALPAEFSPAKPLGDQGLAAAEPAPREVRVPQTPPRGQVSEAAPSTTAELPPAQPEPAFAPRPAAAVPLQRRSWWRALVSRLGVRRR
ncbi:cytochrome P450 [Streptomyces sp. NPDC001902]|nr:cytochrome P450 [Streptomyces sp. PA03-1a]